MAIPNYGMINQGQGDQPSIGNSISGALNQYQQMQEQKKAQEVTGAIQKLQMDKLNLEKKAADLQLSQAPEEFKMKQAEHAARLGQVGASTAAIRQGMGTEDLKQQEYRLTLGKLRHDTVNVLAGNVLKAKPEERDMVYEQSRKHAIASGLPGDLMPKSYKEGGESFVKAAHVQSGMASADAAKELEMLKNPPIKVIDPATGKTVYVRRDQAIGMEAAGAGKSAGIQPYIDKHKAASYAKLNDKAIEESNIAQSTLNNIDTYEAAAAKIPTITNPLTGGLAEYTPAGQAAATASANLALNQLSKLKGATSDRDLDFVKNTVLNLKMTPATAKLVAAQMRAIAQRQLAYQEFVGTQGEKYGYDSGKIQAEWNKFTNKNSLFDKKGNVNQANIGYHGEKEEKPADLSASVKPELGKTITAANGKSYRVTDQGMEEL